VPYKIALRRPGDIASCYADPQRAFDLLGWRAERGLSAMCADVWRWQSGNPNGYAG
ncbi:MAG: UDP-glucose 4-epimerase GalE, partial [Nitrospirales bacterium]